MIPSWLADNLLRVAEQLRPINLNYAFLGGTIVPMLVDDPALIPVRPTDDVDLVILLVRQVELAAIEVKLRERGFRNATYEGAPLCRWELDDMMVDIMPDRDAAFMGLNTRWFPEALRSASLHKLPGGEVPIISAPTFVATKLEAFADRAKGDFFHHDMEDLMTVIDGRSSLLKEFADRSAPLRAFVGAEFRRYLDRRPTLYRFPFGPFAV